MAPRRSAAIIAALGFGVGLAGDACHVASGTTRYEWDGVPEIWRSRAWFSRVDVVIGAAVILALYALTAVLNGQPAIVSVVLTGAIAVTVWAWWDPSPGALAIAAGAAVAGPLAEIVLVNLDAAGYAADSDDLAGVAPWLPCLYFAAGAVASGLWRPIEGTVRDPDPRAVPRGSAGRLG